jgi:hypothetical protein
MARKLTSQQEEFREYLIATGKLNYSAGVLKRQQAEVAEWKEQVEQARKLMPDA